MKVGMKTKKAGPNQFTQPEAQLIEQLRQHPAMMIRIQSIMEIARNAEGPLKTADEVEELLIQEMRQLGNVTLSQWALWQDMVVHGWGISFLSIINLLPLNTHFIALWGIG